MANDEVQAGQETPGEATPGEGTEGESPDQPSLATSADIQTLMAEIQRLNSRMEHTERVRDNWGTEIGKVRKLVEQIPARIQPVNPERDLEELQQNPREFITKTMAASTPNHSQDNGSGVVDERRVSDDERAFRMDHPDNEKYQSRMGELLKMERYRAYDRDGNLDPYKSFQTAYYKAKDEAMVAKQKEAETLRGKTRGEQDALKAGASIPGGGGSGGERPILKDLTPQKIRDMKTPELESLARQMGMIPKNDPLKR